MYGIIYRFLLTPVVIGGLYVIGMDCLSAVKTLFGDATPEDDKVRLKEVEDDWYSLRPMDVKDVRLYWGTGCLKAKISCIIRILLITMLEGAVPTNILLIFGENPTL